MVALASLLVGCTVINHKPVPSDWPKLTIIEAPHSGLWSVIKHCYQYTPLWAKALAGFNVACAEINLITMSCTVHAAPDDAENRRHELDHCAGHDHVGSSVLSDLWSNWKAHMMSGNSAYHYVRHDGAVVAARR